MADTPRVPKTPPANIRANNKYNKKNTVLVSIRLNKKTDADILKRLEVVEESKQGYIKRLIREDIEFDI